MIVGRLTPRSLEPSVATVLSDDVEIDSDIAEGGVEGCASLLASLTERHEVEYWEIPAGGYGPTAILGHPVVVHLMAVRRTRIEVV